MTTVTQPKAQVPIGFVTVAGQRLDVMQSQEMVRFFASLVQRAGGTSGTGTEELTLSQFEDAGIEESKALLFALTDEMRARPEAPVHAVTQDDPSGELASLREEVAALRSRLDALEQGVLL